MTIFSLIVMKIKENRLEKSLFLALMIVLLVVILVAGYHLYSDASYVANLSTQSADQDCDALFKVIHDQMIYANDVTLRKSTPNKKHHWHCFYIRDGMLYHDKKIVKGRKWYDHRRVKMTYVAYIRSKSRIDFTIDIHNTFDHYSKRMSLQLLHFKFENSIDRHSPVAEETYDLNITHSAINKKKLKLYYYNE